MPAALIAQYGVVSEEVAEAMARGIRQRLDAGFGVGITGLAGPDGDGSGKPVGLVYVSLTDGTRCWTRRLQLTGERERVRYIASHHAFDMLRRALTGLPVTD